MANIFAVMALASVIVAVVFSIMIVGEVQKRGVKINFLWLRLYIIKYIHQYRQLTKKETGRVGPLYYPCTVSYQLALVIAIVYLLLR